MDNHEFRTEYLSKSDRHRPSTPSCITAKGEPPAGTFRATFTSGCVRWRSGRAAKIATSLPLRFFSVFLSSSFSPPLLSSFSLLLVLEFAIRSWKLDPDATMSWRVEEALRGFSRLTLCSCPYSASPVATGHPEELHDQEQFRVLASAILFVRISARFSSHATPHLFYTYLFTFFCSISYETIAFFVSIRFVFLRSYLLPSPPSHPPLF